MWFVVLHTAQILGNDSTIGTYTKTVGLVQDSFLQALDQHSLPFFLVILKNNWRMCQKLNIIRLQYLTETRCSSVHIMVISGPHTRVPPCGTARHPQMLPYLTHLIQWPESSVTTSYLVILFYYHQSGKHNEIRAKCRNSEVPKYVIALVF